MQQLKDQESSNIFNLSPEGYNELLVIGVTLDQLYILEHYKKGIDLSDILNSSRFQANKQTLIRRSYLNMDNTVTSTGAGLLEGLKKSAPLEETMNEAHTEAKIGFAEWWAAYPATDIFEHKGKAFKGTRAIRVKKPDCHKKFDAIIAEGQYTVEEMIRALKYDVFLKKEDALRTGRNELRYMPNTLTYLNQRNFEVFIEPSKGFKAQDDKASSPDNSDI